MKDSQPPLDHLLSVAVNAAMQAGSEILTVYYSDTFDVELKSDNSPLTRADKMANSVIMSFLEQTDIPIISEEIKNKPYELRKDWNRAWIVDPLDGTKEFIKKNDEFTVNIALVENGNPILGVVYAPVLDELYFSIVSIGAYKQTQASLLLDTFDFELMTLKANKLPIAKTRQTYTIVGSRSHQSPETESYIARQTSIHTNVDLISKGSSLKLCMVAEGLADEYPRFAPTCEWDTAAGHAIVTGAGGSVIQHDSSMNLIYNKENVLNPWFIVKAN